MLTAKARFWTRTRLSVHAAALGAALGLAPPLWAEMRSAMQTPTYRVEQAAVGKIIYEQQCAACHGANLSDARFAPQLAGEDFRRRWADKSAADAFLLIKSKMPPSAPGSLSPEQTTNLLAYIMQKNTVAASETALPADAQALAKVLMPVAGYDMPGLMAAGVTLPPPPNPTPNPLDKITPVTGAMQRQPAPGDWLTWRRDSEALGFSPLAQINKGNVARLRLAWSWALPNGPNEATPLVHDGVIFAYGHGDVVQALDAATGDLLWEYSRTLPEGVQPSYKKSIALLGRHVFVATSDFHMVALDMANGRVVWDTAIIPEGNTQAFELHGGPLIANGKVVVGTGSYARGTNYIVAFDAESGSEAWRFSTIPKPGETGGDSWNGMLVDQRSGASIWTPGSYDPESNLVFFGPSPTYNTAPLRDLKSGRGNSNEALFTDATIALNADTGKLVWYYSHLPNDQWDFDWAFERQIFDMKVGDATKRVIATAGKQAIYDVLEARTGKYVTSMDLGLQNLVTSIDPRTGAKIIDRANMTPGDGKSKFICPQSGGGKNWYPGAYNPTSRLLFVPLNETCQDMVPVPPGEPGVLTTGVRVSLRPRPDSDGNYGRLQAVDLASGKSVWVSRRRATSTSGVLATAGGLVFTGYLDRTFAAFDDATGQQLWSARLSDVPNANAISYTAHGKQYIAVIAGNGGSMARFYKSLTPEIRNPASPSASIWVFELGD